jgi:hypothetical protein
MRSAISVAAVRANQTPRAVRPCRCAPAGDVGRVGAAVDHVVIDDHAEPLELTPSTVAFTDTPPSLLFTHSHSPCPAPTRSTPNTATVHSSPAAHQRGNTRRTGRDHQTRCSSRGTSSTLTLTIFVEADVDVPCYVKTCRVGCSRVPEGIFRDIDPRASRWGVPLSS